MPVLHTVLQGHVSNSSATTGAKLSRVLLVRAAEPTLVHLNTLPSGPFSVPSVRLMVGSNGKKSICSKGQEQKRCLQSHQQCSQDELLVP